MSKQERLACVLTSNQLDFVAGDHHIHLHSPPAFISGVSLVHVDDDTAGQDERLMKTFATEGTAVHTIGPGTSLVLETLLDISIPEPPPCPALKPPIAKKPKKGSSPGTKVGNSKAKGIGRAVRKLCKTFSTVLRFNVPFTARLRFVDFDDEKKELH